MTVGILALQGCIQPHIEILSSLGVNIRKVRGSADLENLERLILPGGESTTMLRLIHKQSLKSALTAYCRKYPVWGICAGAILLAKEVKNPEQDSLAVMDISAYRNFYGCQLESFSKRVEINSLKFSETVDFIRAPKLTALNAEVSCLAKVDEMPVLLKQGNMLASAFHAELSGSSVLHKYFLDL